MKLEERIKQMLEEKRAAQLQESATEEQTTTDVVAEDEEIVADDTTVVEDESVSEAKCGDEEKDEDDKEEAKKEMKESVSEQISGLFETEGLSEEFKTQAVAIFEAAVADRVMKIEESLKAEFDKEIEAAKEALVENIDGYLSEAVQTWIEENQVALEQSYKADLNESLVDGMFALLAEHNVAIPEETEVLDVAVEKIATLEEQLEEAKSLQESLQSKLNDIEKASILESFKTKMPNTQADRFVKLVESIKFESTEQYTKQLEVVCENFVVSQSKEAEKPTEVVKQITEGVDPVIAQYAQFVSRTAK